MEVRVGDKDQLGFESPATKFCRSLNCGGTLRSNRPLATFVHLAHALRILP